MIDLSLSKSQMRQSILSGCIFCIGCGMLGIVHVAENLA